MRASSGRYPRQSFPREPATLPEGNTRRLAASTVLVLFQTPQVTHLYRNEIFCRYLNRMGTSPLSRGGGVLFRISGRIDHDGLHRSTRFSCSASFPSHRKFRTSGRPRIFYNMDPLSYAVPLLALSRSFCLVSSTLYHFKFTISERHWPVSPSETIGSNPPSKLFSLKFALITFTLRPLQDWMQFPGTEIGRTSSKGGFL
jgi:hypothetical protein